ncbi:MAG: oligosaccharide flippase family protein, partial [Eubacterium sp.]
MSRKKAIIKGTLILTIAGLISRIIGFFYRIFLSNSIGAEGMGIYQLIFPIHAFCMSLCSVGIQTAISRFVAEESAVGNRRCGFKIMRAGLIISIIISVVTAFILFKFSDFIAANIINEVRCGSLLKLIAVSLPLACIHSCISGYFLGIKNASVPAWSQFIEQAVKLMALYLISIVLTANNQRLTPFVAVSTIVISEIGSCIFCIIMILSEKIYCQSLPITKSDSHKTTMCYMKLIWSVAWVLTLNRLMLNFLQSGEAILIPYSLRRFGFSSSDALSIYGVLTGMAFPLIMFPSAIINSIALMLMPTIAEAHAGGNLKALIKSTSTSLRFCFYAGIFCTAVFIIYGNDMGIILFGEVSAGNYITILAWICPFIYLATTLGSILHGLGHTRLIFIHNLISSVLRLLLVIFAVPVIGIKGYLWGVLISQLIATFLHWHYVRKEIPF